MAKLAKWRKIMKILFVMNYRSGEGLTEATNQLIKGLRSEGFQVTISSVYGERGGIGERIQGILKIFAIISQYDYIVAVGCADFGFFPILIGWGFGKLYKKKILINFHEGYPESFMKRFARIVKILIKNTPVVVASGYLFDMFGKYGFKTFLISHHFYYNDFPQRKRDFSWNNKFMWVGTFKFMYDPETALKAAKIILDARNDVEFHFFGNGPLLENMKIKYQHPNIKFFGFIPRDKLLAEYQNFSVFLNSSFGDNFPVRLVEAVFNKLFVISANYGGPPTIYGDTECVFFERGDYKRLSELIFNIINKPHLYDSFRENIYRKVMSFTWENVKDKWLDLIKK